MMGRFIDCQSALVSWGARAQFRRAKVGLLRSGKTIYLVIFFNTKHYKDKFPIDKNTVELLPAAIRFKNLQTDLFIRQVNDKQRYATMIREIKVILQGDKLRQDGKADTLDRFISGIPSFDAIDTRDLMPAPVSARIKCNIALQPPASIQAINAREVINLNINSGDDDIETINNDYCANLYAHKTRNSGQDRRFNNRQLRCIRISGLEQQPKQLWQIDSLQELTLTDCHLTSFPKQLESFSSTLVSLNLSRNMIHKLPITFCCKMSNLTLLNLRDNQIETLPIEIKFFCRLVHLDISNNRLRMLPSTFSDLKRLRTLNVANNNLSQLPAFRKEDIRLKHLDVSHNPLDGALNGNNTFEVHPSFENVIGFNENIYCPESQLSENKFPTLFEITTLNVVRCDRLLKLASEESLPKSIVSTIQRDIFKCYKCSRMNMLPAYNSTDILDYVDQVETLITTGNYRRGMTFMKLICRSCFDNMSS